MRDPEMVPGVPGWRLGGRGAQHSESLEKGQATCKSMESHGCEPRDGCVSYLIP